MMTTVSLANAQRKISFELSFKEPQAHYVEVRMELSGFKEKYLDLKMPVWAPGSYLVREFPKNVESFSAESESKKGLASHKIDKNTWRVETDNENRVIVNYRVYAFEISVRTSFIDASHAFLSPTGIFMYVNDLIKQPVEVRVKPYEGWTKISTGLEAVEGKANTFYASDFDILFDSPIEVGNQNIFGFEAAGVKHEVAMVGEGNYDEEQLKRDMTRIIEDETKVFGVNPNKRYVFIVHNYASGGGGLEHLNSTVLGASRFNYQNPNGYLNFLGLVAHEYFHVWNIKRLRPEALGPFNYNKENYTTNLWVSEGFTAYYDNLILRRGGFYNEAAYLKVLAADIEAVENRGGNLVQPLSLSSFDAWIRQYRPDENSINTMVSYYNKGALIGMLIDLKTLHATQGAKGLDDVMKAMYDEYYQSLDRGFTDQEFKQMVEKVSGVSIDDIYEYVNEAKPINYNKYLNNVGLELVNLLADHSIPEFGVRVSNHKIMSVNRGSGAWDAGINVNDELIAVNGYRMDDMGKELDRILSNAKIGDKVHVIVSRDGIIKELDVILSASLKADYLIRPLATVTPEQSKLREIWLSLESD
ncbi:M61 family metallopeptidase [Albibacterium sp.]|uniref:M61 family metallopeptidase n=1 Tax=Albibacterium sp. TaxID=2952885 RepID=UPI002CD93362|nr:PDZ domain-containing protein [Albibacterium sp.]HUH19925.1 PDZ domain-containing protein [Albibacterium sp.]